MELKSNLWKYNAFHFFRNLIFMIPIIAVFFLDNGMDMREIMMLQSVFAVIVVILEVPSGYFADRFGRKNSLIIGSFTIFIASIIYVFAGSFHAFLAAEVFWGIGNSFCSGAENALIYDTLAELNMKKKYKKVEGHAQFLARISEGTASLAGAFLAAYNLRLAFIATAVTFMVLTIVSMTFREPERHASVITEGHFRNMYKIIRFALHRNKVVKWLIIYSGLIALFGVSSFWFSQPYLKMLGIPIIFFGVIFAIEGVVGGFASKYAYLYEDHIGLKRAVISLPLISAASLILLGRFVAVASIVAFFFLQFVRGIEAPLISDLINRIVWPQNRATVLSISNLVGRLMFVVFSPFFGWYADIYTIPQALILCGGLMLTSGIITLIFMHRHKAI